MYIYDNTHEFFINEKYWVIETTEGEECIPRRWCFNSDEIYMFLDGDEISGNKPYITRGSLVREGGPEGAWRTFRYRPQPGKPALEVAKSQI